MWHLMAGGPVSVRAHTDQSSTALRSPAVVEFRSHRLISKQAVFRMLQAKARCGACKDDPEHPFSGQAGWPGHPDQVGRSRSGDKPETKRGFVSI